jgi:hypothetical protein
MNDPQIKIIKYQDDIEALMDGDRKIWLTAEQISKLIDVPIRTIYHHITNYKDVSPKTDVENSVQLYCTNPDDARTATEHYNVDVLIYIAYRMNKRESNERVYAFRRWVSSIVDRYLRGDLRQAEKHTYEDVRDFISKMSDYDPHSKQAKTYYAQVQNKLLFAVTGMTAAGLLMNRANHTQPNMGLQTWGGQKITQSDAVIGKNYLTRRELEMLHGLVNVIAFSLKQYEARHATMAQWERYIDAQIELTFERVLIGWGNYSPDEAKDHARREYAAFKKLLGNGNE